MRHHSFLDRVHLRTDNPEVTSKVQQENLGAVFSVFSLTAVQGLWMREKGVKGKVRVNDRWGS